MIKSTQPHPVTSTDTDPHRAMESIAGVPSRPCGHGGDKEAPSTCAKTLHWALLRLRPSTSVVSPTANASPSPFPLLLLTPFVSRRPPINPPSPLHAPLLHQIHSIPPPPSLLSHINKDQSHLFFFFFRRTSNVSE